MNIFCDFDGTITTCDTTDLILSQLADPLWEEVEADWEAGRIDSAECMRLQIGLIKANIGRIDDVLHSVQLRDGFWDFLQWTRRQNVPLTIVSDGIDYFIDRILANHGINMIPIVSNRLMPAGDNGGWQLDQPWRSRGCGSGVCKCAVLAERGSGGPLIFIGDGRSDFCVSARPDILFATGKLIAHAEAQDRPHLPFSDFFEIRTALESWSATVAYA